MVYDNNAGGKYGKFFVQELKEPPSMGTPEFRELYKQLPIASCGWTATFAKAPFK